MNNLKKRMLSRLLVLTMLMTCSFFETKQVFSEPLNIIDPETGNGTWSFLSSNPNYLDTNLASSPEASKLVSIGDYTDSDKVNHNIYVIGGNNNPSNGKFTYGDMTFIGTSDAAITFRAFRGFGRVNVDPGTSVSIPVKGNCSISILMFVDANPVSGSEGYIGNETGETDDGKITLYADDVEFASQTPIKLDKGSNQLYSFTYTGDKEAEIKITNTGSKIIAFAGISIKHVVQVGADINDCSESDNFPFSGNVYVVGDSNVCEYNTVSGSSIGIQGWGAHLKDYLAQDINVKNLAVSGKSSRSFINEPNYTTLAESLKTGDYLLIPWGANDEKVQDDYITPTESKYENIYSVPISKIGDGTLDWTKSQDGFIDDGKGNKVPCFEWFLYNKYVKPAREKGAQPVLITPVTRISSSGAPQTNDKHNVYSAAIRKLAADYNVPLADLFYDSQTQWNEIFQTSGIEGTKLLHVLNEDGSLNSHLSVKGASLAAKLVMTDIKRLGLSLSKKSTIVPEKVKEITLDANALQTNVSTMTFKTVRDAMKFIESCNTPSSEEERVTLNFKKGTYREQIFVNAPYLTFKNADTTDYKDVVLTWYYGIGYKYYSIGEDGFYNKDLARENKLTDNYTAPAKNWGHTIRINATATGFKADNITFESSFNRYVTREEIEDGCVPVNIVLDKNKKVINEEGLKFYKDGTGGTKPDRASLGAGSTKVQEKDYRERSCAFFILADKAEMTGCYFVSEQDTLGTNYMRQYYKNCVIEGTVDYICGTGNSIFDNCELKWGTTANASGGYVHAPKGNYLFYNCKVTGNGNDKTNSWGRPWGKEASNATMFKTVITKNKNGKLNILGAGYTAMNSTDPKNAKFYEYGSVDENGNPIDTKSRTSGTVITDKWKMLELNPYNYTTGKYGIDNTANVKFTVDDWDPMGRAERMKPIIEGLNFDISEENERVLYDTENKLYQVFNTNIVLPPVAEGYERKIVSDSSNVTVSEDGNNLLIKLPLSDAADVSTKLTVYLRETDSDEWGDTRVINLKLLPKPTSLEKGDFNGDTVVNTADAASLLEYILDPSAQKFNDYTELNLNAGKVADKENGTLTARDVSEILKKILDPNFEFTCNK